MGWFSQKTLGKWRFWHFFRLFWKIFVKLGGHYKVKWGWFFSKNCKITPPTIKHKRVLLIFSFKSVCHVFCDKDIQSADFQYFVHKIHIGIFSITHLWIFYVHFVTYFYVSFGWSWSPHSLYYRHLTFDTFFLLTIVILIFLHTNFVTLTIHFI